MEEIKIEVCDKYGDKCLHDKFSSGPSNRIPIDRKPEGFVKIFEIDKNGQRRLVAKPNLVVYQGREWIVERVFNLANGQAPTIGPTYYLSWFGIGSGGTGGGPFDPVDPTASNTNLVTPLSISTSDTNSGDEDGGYYYKRTFDTGGVVILPDSLNANAYLEAEITTTLETTDANGPGGSQNINEAGLFLETGVEDGQVGDFPLFARVTFNTIVKDSSRQLVFIWSVYF